jgi:hypothetical protein
MSLLRKGDKIEGYAVSGIDGYSGHYTLSSPDGTAETISGYSLTRILDGQTTLKAVLANKRRHRGKPIGYVYRKKK